MANPFAIKAASNTILLDSQRQGQTTFTVTNLLGLPLRGRARLVAQQTDAAPWLAILGDAERDFTIAGTQQYGVQVTVPASGAAGSYSFRLDMTGVDNPDELFTEGPTVTFSVVPPPPPPPPRPRWIPYALIGGVVLFLCVLGIVFLSRQSPILLIIIGVLLFFLVLILLGIGFIVCGYEYFSMVAAAGYRPERWLGVVLIAALLGDALLQRNATRLILLGVLILPPLLELRRQDHSGFLPSWALTALGVMYFGIIGAHYYLLLGLPSNGAAQLSMTLVATIAANAIGYIVGITLGHHPFFPTITPKKTLEGVIGGVVAAALAFGILSSFAHINPVIAIVGGIGVGVAGTLGDLVEALVKRQVGVEDSSSLLFGYGGVWDWLGSLLLRLQLREHLVLRGYGGVWDRLASFQLAMVFAYYFFVAVPR